MRDNTEELIEEISSLEKILKGKMIELIKSEMAWARLRYDEGGSDYAERIEFADFYFELNDFYFELNDFYFELNDILEEYKDDDYYRISEVGNLKLKMERAYSSLRSSVHI